MKLPPRAAWLVQGGVLLAAGVVVLLFGVSLTTVRVATAVAMLVVARHQWTRARGGGAGRVAAAGLAVLGVVGVFSPAMPVGLAWGWAASAWVVAGIGGLFTRDADVVSGWWLFAGLVTATSPYRMFVDLGVYTGAFLIVAGSLSVLRGLWRPKGVWTRWVAGVGAVVLLAAYGGLVLRADRIREAQDRLAAFYEVPVEIPPGAPGDLIRVAPMERPGSWRILYWSQDRYGHMTVVSGTVWAPTTRQGFERGILAWTHGTVGLAAQCAPSRNPDPAYRMSWLDDALGRGWVVAATDYAGAAGTGDTERYMVAADQARDALNSARAARHLTAANAGDRLMIFGASQGGLIALEAAAIAGEYAPELRLQGVAASAPASDMGAMVNEGGGLGDWWVGSMIARVYPEVYPAARPEAILTPEGLGRYREVSTAICDTDMVAAVPRAVAMSRFGAFFAVDPMSDPDWRAALEDNRAPDMPPGVPVLLAQGTEDKLVEPRFTRSLVDRYCAMGTPVAALWLDGVGHDGSTEAAPSVLEWFGSGSVQKNCP